jgi:hypothetical protein
MVERQAAMLSYNDAFRFLALMFLVMFPLIFLRRKPKKGGRRGDGSLESIELGSAKDHTPSETGQFLAVIWSLILSYSCCEMMRRLASSEALR